MIDLLKNYNELQTATDYKKSLRYVLAKKKLDTLFLKWLASNKTTVEELLKKAQSGKLKASEELNPLFVHHKVPMTDSMQIPGSMLNTQTPPISQNLSDRNSVLRRPYNDRELGKSLTLSTLIPQTVDSHGSNQIPQFYFPNGKPMDPATEVAAKAVISAVFGDKPAVSVEMSKKLTEVTGLPNYFSVLIAFRCTNNPEAATITKVQLLKVWRELEGKDLQRRAFWLLSGEVNKKWITVQDFQRLFKQILRVHPGLKFLKETPQFQDWYSVCVIHRMYYIANKKHDYRLTYREFKQSNILKSIIDIENEPDINLNNDFFSYEDFYVIYLKFWQLDSDHDFFLTQEQLSKYHNYTLSRKTLQRIFSQTARRFLQPNKMGFGDFVWFLLVAQDKTAPQSIEYWFKIMDLDGNEMFFDEQSQRLVHLDSTIDANFENMICQMKDLFKPVNGIQFTLQDFLKRPMDSSVFFNMLTDIHKFIAYEQRDAYEDRNIREANPNWNDWDRFAKLEYRKLTAQTDHEEGGEQINWDQERQDD